MADTVSDYLLRRLQEWGMARIYGYPGDGINGILGALGRAGDAMQFVQVRHEEMAAFMACAHAKFTGDVGVCLAATTARPKRCSRCPGRSRTRGILNGLAIRCDPTN